MARSNEEIYKVVQHLLMLGKIKDLVESLQNKDREILISEFNSRKLDKGPIEEFDGPNGGITLSEVTEMVFDQRKLAKVFGTNTVQSFMKTTLDVPLVKAFCKSKNLSKEDMVGLCSKVEEKKKIVPVYQRTNTSRDFDFNVSEILVKNQYCERDKNDQ